MFRAHPFWFILCVLLIAVCTGIIILRATAQTAADGKLISVLLIAAIGFGFITLLYWYLKTRATALILTDSELVYERGILSKDRTSMSLKSRPIRQHRARVRPSHSRGRDNPDLHRRRPAGIHHPRHARSAFDPGGDCEGPGHAQQ